MTSHYSSEDQSSEQLLIEEVKRRLLERAERVDVAWESGPDGWYIARGNAIKVLLGFDLPENAQSLLETGFKGSELAQFTRIIIQGKRRVTVLFAPLRYRP